MMIGLQRGNKIAKKNQDQFFQKKTRKAIGLIIEGNFKNQLSSFSTLQHKSKRQRPLPQQHRKHGL
jgi:hypothetical protein